MVLFLKSSTSKPQAGRIARLTAALRLAIAHLEGDAGQSDISAAEHREDLALVAKLKEALQ